ncbi:MAG: hypothetical protein MK212_02270 [Saprospiraceae bacterium]|nr:hypothetical protein [Saprospiraceae bacterium]
MRLLTFLFLCTFLWACSGSMKYDRAYYEAFPSYDDIALSYYVEHPNYPRGEYVKFQKQKTGWYVYLINVSTHTVNDSIHIWDAKKQAYLDKYKFTAEKKSKSDEVKKGLNTVLANKIRRYRRFDYYINPLAGYDNAHLDVIDLFEGADLKKLTVDEIQGLARAYNRATILSYGSLHNGTQPEGVDIEAGQKYAAKALEIFGYLKDNHPKHEGIVGEMPVKYNASCMDYWLFAQYNGIDGTAYLNKADYPAAMVAMAKNYLSSCPQNAILITYGDNDTYPLWYVQEKLEFRKDVIVLNISLLASNRNLDYMHKQYVTSGKLKLSFQKEDYEKKGFDYMLLSDGLNAKYLPRYLSLAKIVADESDAQRRILPKDFYLSAQDTSVTISINSNYIDKGGLILLDLIQNNIYERPICWTDSRSNSVLEALKKHEENLGLVEILNLKQSNPNAFGINIVQHEKLKNYFLNEAEWASAAERNVVKEAVRPSSNVLFAAYLKLLSHYVEEDPASAHQLIDHLLKSLPPSEITYGQMGTIFAQILADTAINRNKDALIVLDNYANSFKEAIQRSKLKNTTGYFTFLPMKTEEELRKNWLEGLSILKTTADPKLTAKLEELTILIEK